VGLARGQRPNQPQGHRFGKGPRHSKKTLEHKERKKE